MRLTVSDRLIHVGFQGVTVVAGHGSIQRWERLTQSRHGVCIAAPMQRG